MGRSRAAQQQLVVKALPWRELPTDARACSAANSESRTDRVAATGVRRPAPVPSCIRYPRARMWLAFAPFPTLTLVCLSAGSALESWRSLVRAMAVDGAQDTYEVEELLAERIRDKGGRVLTEYLVKWVGYSTEDNTWEPHRNILDIELMHRFEARRCAPPGFSAKQRQCGGLGVGTIVEANWQAEGRWFPGRVAAVHTTDTCAVTSMWITKTETSKRGSACTTCASRRRARRCQRRPTTTLEPSSASTSGFGATVRPACRSASPL